MPPPPRALPHKPAYLVRASLASKPWLALLSSARFRDRYHEFHGAPPMLGLLVSRPWNCLNPRDLSVPPFISTTKFRPRGDSGHSRDYAVWDCRHGRVLLGEKNAAPMKLAIWDPMTGRRRELQEPGCMVVDHEDGHLGAAVVCGGASGCDHRACPSRVAFFSLHYTNGRSGLVAQVCMSLPPETGEWSQPCFALPIDNGFIEPRPPVLVQDAIHFMLAFDYEYAQVDVEVHYGTTRVQILKYDLSSSSLSLIDAPPRDARHYGNSILMALEDGTLGFARWKRLRIYIWSRQIGSDGVAAWTRRTAISLENIPPINVPRKGFTVEGSLEGRDIIFVSTELGIYKINLKTLRRKKISNQTTYCNNALIPYMSFYKPTRNGQSL